jgi:hypothetical protein
MITPMAIQTTIWLAALGGILFVAADDWGWPQGWAFLGGIAISSFAVSLWLGRHDPDLLEARLSAPVQQDQRQWDRIFLAAGAGFCRLVGAERPGRSSLPVVARSTLGAGCGGRADRSVHDPGLADVSLQHVRRPADTYSEGSGAAGDH